MIAVWCELIGRLRLHPQEGGHADDSLVIETDDGLASHLDEVVTKYFGGARDARGVVDAGRVRITIERVVGTGDERRI